MKKPLNLIKLLIIAVLIVVAIGSFLTLWLTMSQSPNNPQTSTNSAIPTGNSTTLEEVGFTINLPEGYTLSPAEQGAHKFYPANNDDAVVNISRGFLGFWGSTTYMINSDLEEATPQLVAMEFFSLPMADSFLAQENSNDLEEYGEDMNEARDEYSEAINELETTEAYHITSSPLRWIVWNDRYNSPYDISSYTNRLRESLDEPMFELSEEEESAIAEQEWRDTSRIIRYYITTIDEMIAVAAVATGLNALDYDIREDMLEEFRSGGNTKKQNELVLEKFGKDAVAQADALVAALNITKIK